MTATINASTSAGVVTTADTSGILQLQTNGTAALTVDASQNVGVGTSSPNKRLNATKASSTAYSASDFDIDSLALQLANTTNDKSTGIYFAIGSNGEAAISAVETSDGETALTFGTRGSGARLERARLNSTGAFVLAGGTTTADGIGITFPATQSASTNANTLDDYEEGTWTPVLADAASGGNTGTFVNASATYTKIGKQVTINAYLNSITTTGMTAGNTVFIRGLPFVGNGNFHGNFYSYRVGRNASTVSSCAALTSNVAVYFPLFTTNSATTDLSILVSNVVSGISEIIFTVTYFV